MKRKQRTEILLNSPHRLAERLALEIFSHYVIRNVEEPNNGLVMVKVRETAKRGMFYLGEVFVTECKVMIEGQPGIGIVQGHKPELAYHLAIIDAAYNAELPETVGWTELFLAEEQVIEEEQAAQQAKILKTRVNFETMQV
jgi:alpha-D-ribose 1-methylphosphonate 5-triphosphate synthase subunit PhnG